MNKVTSLIKEASELMEEEIRDIYRYLLKEGNYIPDHYKKELEQKRTSLIKLNGILDEVKYEYDLVTKDE
jgi:hypothetical protein